MSGKSEKHEGRRPYVKPEVRRVMLKPEESLVAGCKTLSQSAFGAPTCDANSCMNLGS
jgi:hypothetical protein